MDELGWGELGGLAWDVGGGGRRLVEGVDVGLVVGVVVVAKVIVGGVCGVGLVVAVGAEGGGGLAAWGEEFGPACEEVEDGCGVTVEG